MRGARHRVLVVVRSRQNATVAAPAHEGFDEVGGGDDGGSVDEVVGGDASGAGAGTAGPDAAAVGDEVGEDLPDRRVVGEGDLVGVAAGGEPDGVGGEEDDGVLVGGGRHVADDEGQRGLLGVVGSVGALDEDGRGRGRVVGAHGQLSFLAMWKMVWVVGSVVGVARGCVHEAVAGEPAPRRHADTGGGVVGVDLDHLAGLEVSHRLGDERREIDARHARCVEGAMRCGHGLTARNVCPNTR
jgi:hypothetical protein